VTFPEAKKLCSSAMPFFPNFENDTYFIFHFFLEMKPDLNLPDTPSSSTSVLVLVIFCQVSKIKKYIERDKWKQFEVATLLPDGCGKVQQRYDLQHATSLLCPC
jgi:hypothetical protein